MRNRGSGALERLPPKSKFKFKCCRPALPPELLFFFICFRGLIRGLSLISCEGAGNSYSKSENHAFRFLPVWGLSKGRKPLANLNKKEVGTTSFIISPTCADIRFYRHKALATDGKSPRNDWSEASRRLVGVSHLTFCLLTERRFFVRIYIGVLACARVCRL